MFSPSSLNLRKVGVLGVRLIRVAGESKEQGLDIDAFIGIEAEGRMLVPKLSSLISVICLKATIVFLLVGVSPL